jgi:opacity protein-like surface antigen
MNMRMLVSGLALGALLGAFAPGDAAAELSPNRSNLGAHLGYSKAKDADGGNFLLGGHLEIMPVPFLGVRGAVDYRTVESFDYGYGGTDGSFDIRSIPVTVEGRLYLPGASVSPYAALGAGWYFLKYDFSDNLEALGFQDDSDSEFGWHLGAGLTIAVAPSIAVFGEAKAVFMDANRTINDETLDAVVDFDYDSTYFSTGINLLF